MTCPYCGADYQENHRFCAACGGVLPAAAKKGSHRVPVLILAGLSILGIAAYFAFPQATPEAPPAQVQEDRSWFTAKDGNLQFDKDAYTGPEQLVVPERIGLHHVEWIDDNCFEDCDMLSEIVLPESVRHIGTASFTDCDALRGIDLPQGLITLGREAFADCDRLEAVHVPDSVNFIGADAFDGCGSLRYVFYDGTRQKWRQVCGQDLGPDVTVICSDGNIS